MFENDTVNLMRPIRFVLALLVGGALALAGPAAGETIELDTLLLYSATDEIQIDADTILEGASAAAGKITLDDDVQSGAVYTEDELVIGRRVTVVDRALAVLDIDIDRDFTFTGSAITGDEVTLDRNASVTGNIEGRDDSVSVGRNSTVIGDVLSNDKIVLNNNAMIQGAASPGIGYSVQFKPGAVVTGSTDPAAHILPTFDLPDMPSAPSVPDHGDSNVYASSESTVDLDPGRYKALSLERDCELYLTSGEYTFKSFWMDKRGIVNVDTSAGDVIINVHETFDTGQYVQFNPTGDGKVIINVYGTGGISLDKYNVMRATVHVWDGDFSAAEQADFRGTILARGKIWIAEESTLVYAPGTGGYFMMPEPATMVLLVSGAGFVLTRRRRR
ncbi:MAG: PEP-CTERM sorting domain-containing protein [Planctomycetota bacterium]